MSKKILISTWCTDDYAELLNVEKLQNSLKYFHPEVDHIIFNTEMTNKVYEEYSWMRPAWMMAVTCMPFIDDYDMVIHLDADVTVTGPLDEFFNSPADVVGVRNNNSLNQAGGHRGITIPHSPPFGNGQPIPVQQFINAGMIGVNRKEFWYDWHNLNEEVAKTGMSDEQDTLNNLFHWKKYKSEVIDVMGTGVSYGLSNVWGTGDNHWESWSQIYVKDGGLYLNDPVTGDPMCVKVMHQAGGSIAAEVNISCGGFRNWLSSVVSDEVNDYLNEVSNG